MSRTSRANGRKRLGPHRKAELWFEMEPQTVTSTCAMIVLRTAQVRKESREGSWAYLLGQDLLDERIGDLDPPMRNHVLETLSECFDGTPLGDHVQEMFNL